MNVERTDAEDCLHAPEPDRLEARRPTGPQAQAQGDEAGRQVLLTGTAAPMLLSTARDRDLIWPAWTPQEQAAWSLGRSILAIDDDAS